MSQASDVAYCFSGRPSVPTERILKAMLLQAIYSVRSERELCRRIDTDLLFRWFLDPSHVLGDPAEDAFRHTVFPHNRERLEQHGFVQRFFDGVVRMIREAGLASDDHFTVDGTLIQSHASLKSLKRIAREDGSAEAAEDRRRRGGRGVGPRGAGRGAGDARRPAPLARMPAADARRGQGLRRRSVPGRRPQARDHAPLVMEGAIRDGEIEPKCERSLARWLWRLGATGRTSTRAGGNGSWSRRRSAG